MAKRRDFIKKSAIGAAGIAIGGMGFSAKSYASIIGANDRITMAVIGIRGRGTSHIEAWCKLKDSHNVRLKTLCDVDEQFWGPRAKLVVDNGGEKPITEWDMHKVLADPDIDAVSFATPNHWHALGTVLACQAGKHVYVEKPASHNVWEGRKMIEAARKYNRRVQVGFQNRSKAKVMEAIQFLHDGGIGKVYMARGLCIKPRDSFGITKDGAPPSSLHYDRWLGPATWRPYNEKKGHYNWHWFWDTGNGDTGNQGPHQFDIARWGLNKNEHPVSIYSSGGFYGVHPEECAQETPNTQNSIFKYKDGTMLEFETRGRYSNEESNLGIRIGNIFYGTEGWLEIDGGKWNAYREREKEPFAGSKTKAESNKDISLTGPSNTAHFSNFIDAIRSGKNEDLHCDINEGFFSTVLPLTANISYRLQRELKFMGSNMDQEKIVDDDAANALLTRAYRLPYVVPNVV
ncbi:Gfo/Idh/MocA family protein [Maribellus maritimus]|uniref:Gfo/Idh/MocA family protein n=1 Tax=Maribellus maritimus TaxID=2870838 RepID=UPI001EECD2C9|nr:Gfo/Idh/MocA family oxidoreductase [Maribellus maritimus]MCG6191010.1 Gfo/Idh/MocA family oxidoreductase [Maribellus maritimus]